MIHLPARYDCSPAGVVTARMPMRPAGGTVGTNLDYWFDGAPVVVLADGGGFDYWDPGRPVVTG